MKKIYEVIFQDEWNNLYYVGRYNSLDEAVPDINAYLDPYDMKVEKGEIKEYPTTLSTVFDTSLADIAKARGLDENFIEERQLGSIMIRGFILQEEKL